MESAAKRKTSSARLLYSNLKFLFEFEMTRVVEYGPEMPYFSERFGHISAFIEVPWVTKIEELKQTAQDHRRQTYARRNAPREAERLRQDMKRFGL